MVSIGRLRKALDRRLCRSKLKQDVSISGLVVEYNVAIVVTRVRFPADAEYFFLFSGGTARKIEPKYISRFSPNKIVLMGLEPTIFSLGGRRLIH